MKRLGMAPPGNAGPTILAKSGIRRGAPAWVPVWHAADCHLQVLTKWAGKDTTRLPRLYHQARLGS